MAKKADGLKGDGIKGDGIKGKPTASPSPAKPAGGKKPAPFPTPDQNRFIAQGAHDKYVAQFAKDNGYSLKPGNGMSIVNQLDYTLGGWTGSASMGSDRGGGTTYFYGPAGGGGVASGGSGGSGSNNGGFGGIKGDGIKGDGIKGDGIKGKGFGGEYGNVQNDGSIDSILSFLAIQNQAAQKQQQRWQNMQIKSANENRIIAGQERAAEEARALALSNQNDVMAKQLQGTLNQQIAMSNDAAQRQGDLLKAMVLQQQTQFDSEYAAQQEQNAQAQIIADKQEQKADAMTKAYVPELQETALSLGVGDSRLQLGNSYKSSNTLSGLSILTGNNSPLGSLSGLQIA